MKHLGDITKINGAEIPIVDIITGGSPCQDLSVAGKRAGLKGERSGLFMEQIRIIKEMRNESIRQLQVRGAAVDIRHIRPRFMVWENVFGAFSSNKGEDFRVVLEEICRVANQTATVPRPEKGKWSTSGCIMGDGWSIAWRVHDAQFWGVPQRRKRIALVADFGGQSAPEILFERKGLPGNTSESGKEGQGITTDAEAGTNQTIGFNRERCGAVTILNKMPTSYDMRGRINMSEISPTLSTGANDLHCVSVEGFDNYNLSLSGETAKTLQSEGGGSGVNEGCVLIENHPNDSRVKIREDGKVQTLSGRMGTSGGNVPMVMENTYQKTTGSLMASGYSKLGTQEVTNDMYVVAMTTEMTPKIDEKGKGFSLRSRDYKDPQCVTYANEAYDKWSESEKGASLRASGGVYGGGSESLSVGYVVRRLTPLECERLQGFPEHWTDIGDWVDSKGKKHKGDSDSPRYKALGNSIALPFWEWMAKRMVDVLKADGVENPTMGSLFDGIGGFPLAYSRAGAIPVWASEIEEFPIAVTKLRFKEGE